MAAPRFQRPDGMPVPFFPGPARGRAKPPPKKPPAYKPGGAPGTSMLDQVAAEIAALYAPAQGEIDRQRTEETTRTAERAALIRSLYGQLAGIQGNVAPQIAGLFSGAAENTAAFGKGYSESMQGNLDATASEANALQSIIGAPEGQRVQGGEAAANVLYGTSGAIPASTLEAQGAAFGSAAAYLPGATFGRGMVDIQSLLSDSAERLKELDKESRELGVKQTQARADLLKERKELKKQEAKELYDAGFMTQRELARLMGVKNWRKFPNALKGEEAAKPSLEWSRELGYLVDENLSPILDRKGKTIPLTKDQKLQRFQMADGSDWLIDMNTGNVVRQIGGPKANPPMVRGGPSTGYDYFDPVTGAHLGHTDPTYVKPDSAKNTPLWKQHGFKSAADMNSTANKLAGEARGKTNQYGLPDPENPPMSGQEAFDYLVSNNIPPMVAWRKLKGRYPKLQRPKVEPASGGRSNVSYSNKTAWMANLWIQAGGDPSVAGTAAAIAMAESGGRVDAWNGKGQDRSAGLWQINYYGGLRKPRTRQFGTPEQLRKDPLANARAAVAIYRSAGNSFSPWTTYTSGAYKQHVGSQGSQNVSYNPNAEWAGSREVASPLRGIAESNGLSVSSEKRSKKGTASGGVSDHWTGSKGSYAYDMSGSVGNMDKAAKALMAQFGVNWRGGEIVKNFYNNGYRIQILYRTNVGGNHFDHIHIGVRYEGGQSA